MSYTVRPISCFRSSSLALIFRSYASFIFAVASSTSACADRFFASLLLYNVCGKSAPINSISGIVNRQRYPKFLMPQRWPP